MILADTTFMLFCFRSAFSFNPSVQTRSFLILGIISSHASANVITKILKVIEEVNNILLLLFVCLNY